MVYCGKPSRSCHACRERKTRCDAKVGGCTQCVRAKRKCPGYRAQVDLIFRDQSQNVVRKAKIREAKNSLQSEVLKVKSILDESESPFSNGRLEIFHSQTAGWTYSLAPTIEDRATCYFVSNHAMGMIIPGYGDVNNMTATHMLHVMDPTLASSLKATSLASYAHHVRSLELAKTSHYHYTNAIRLTNTALASPVHAAKDSTLLSVLLLGLYEILTGQDQRSLEDWAKHAHGAAALLKLRGHDQFESPVGRRIFLQATSNVLSSCIQRRIRIPEYIMQMTHELVALMSTISEAGRKGARMFQAMLEYNQFRCDMSEGMIPAPEALIARAIECDEPLAAICKSCPCEWRYEVVRNEKPESGIVFDGCYHVYQNIWGVSIWNFVRTFRLLIHQTIREVLLKGFASKPPTFTLLEYTAQYQRSTDICYEMQAGILASVPHCLGFVRNTGVRDETMNMGDVKSTWTHIISDIPTGPSSGGYTLLWPLWYAGFVDIATEDIRIYCMKNLRRVGENMGIQQAFLLAQVIETNVEPEVWSQNPFDKHSLSDLEDI